MTNAMTELGSEVQACIAKAEPALERAAEIASSLKLEPESAFLRSKAQDLKNDRFVVLVFGRFRSGKSTLLNALLGKPSKTLEGLPYSAGPLPTDINPCTVRPTRIYYAPEPKVSVIERNGQRTPWTFHQYFHQSKQLTTKEETDMQFRDILGFDLGFPTKFCQNGVDLYDSPGTDDTPDLDLTTLALAQKADVVVYVTPHPGTFGRSEQTFLDNMKVGGLTSVLTVVNARDAQGESCPTAMPPTEHTRANIWDRIVTQGRKGPRFANQALETEDIYILNAQQAFRGRMTDNEAEVRTSGIAAFEERLARYLSDKPRFKHLNRHISAAQAKLQDIRDEISRRRFVLQIDRQKFEERLAKLKNELDEIPRQAKHIKMIIEGCKAQTTIAIQQSLESLFEQISHDLPFYMKEQKIPSLHKQSIVDTLIANFNIAIGLRSQICEEAMNIARQYVQEKVAHWRTASVHEPGAAQILSSHLMRMVEDIESEARLMEVRYCDFQLGLTGWNIKTERAKVKGPSLSNRITAAAFGVLAGNITITATAISGAAQGWGGIFNGILAQIAIMAPLIFMNVALPIAAPIAIAGGIAWNLFRTTKAVEDKVIEETVSVLLHGCEADPSRNFPGFGGLTREPHRMRAAIATAIAEKFDLVEKAVMVEVNDRIQFEASSLQNQHSEASKSADDRAETLKALEGYEIDIKRCNADLNDALAGAAQI